MAEHCARLWLAEADADLVLVGRSAERLRRVAADLTVRSPASRIECVAIDFADPATIGQTVSAICTARAPDIVLIAHGCLPDQAACQFDSHVGHEALMVNGVSPALFAEAFARHMASGDPACVILIGSVAGDRGRQSNYVYGAAKGLLERYVQGMRHRLALSRSALKVVLVKPGPTATPMTATLAAQGQPLASVEAVALAIVRGAAKGKAVVYTPGKWRLIMLVIRGLPDAIFHKLKI
jgi:short-subunit dehydrogenase